MTHDPETVDVAIVGAGAAGAFLAARLAEAGRSVVVLESGPDRELGQLVSSQIWARRLKWGGPPVLAGGADRFGHNMTVGWGIGGSALHHYGGWPRLHPEDFRTRTRYGRARDWPVDYDALRPHYDRIQSRMGVSGDAAREPWRPPGEPYPMPPVPAFPQGETLTRGFARLGIRVAPAPLAINSIPYQGRSVCLFDGWCDAGCPIGALANPLVLDIPRARAAGAVFRPDCTVTRIVSRRRGEVDGVEYVAEGTRRLQRAAIVVLAAGAVQNVRLLLVSADENAPAGLGNGSRQVGRHFCCHTVLSVFGVFDEVQHNHLGTTAGPLISQEHYRKDFHPGAFGSYQWGIAPALKPNDLLGIANSRPECFGTALHRFLHVDAPRLASMSAVCEVINQGDDRIELTDRRDPHGVPLARIVLSLGDHTRTLRQAAIAEGLAVMHKAGARAHWVGPAAFAHPLGGAIMGDDLRTSVTDSYGRVHGLRNLYVAGGGLFPTAGGGSPTFTIYALADRTADHLLHSS